MSTISPEQRINMSLDELIKVNKKTVVKKQPKKPAAAPAATSNKKKGGVTVKPSNNAQPSKTAVKVIGAAKAKREAATNQKRGLNPTGKATKNDIKKAVAKASVPAKGKPIQRRPNMPSANALPSLKITFKPKDLNQTTPNTVLQQIKGALAKQPNKPRNPGATKRTPGGRGAGKR